MNYGFAMIEVLFIFLIIVFIVLHIIFSFVIKNDVMDYIVNKTYTVLILLSLLFNIYLVHNINIKKNNNL